MKKSFLFFLYLFLISGIKIGLAQNANAVRISEILVINYNNAIDDFGNHSPWLELFNTSYNYANIGGCYLTNDLNNPTKYWIPTNNPLMVIPPREYLVFWANNNPTQGVFHLNFDLETSKLIALYDVNGKTLIDKVTLPKKNKADITFGIPYIDSKEWAYLDKSTPGSSNDYSKKPTAGEIFVKIDPYGVGMIVISMSVVFFSLASLFLIYKSIGRYFLRQNVKQHRSKQEGILQTEEEEHGMTGEVSAAIAMAIHQFLQEEHDVENTVLTIQRVSRNYSPWSSKIYSLQKSPR